jgi:hypothetical protein
MERGIDFLIARFLRSAIYSAIVIIEKSSAVFFLNRQSLYILHTDGHPLIVERQLLANQHFTFRVNPGNVRLKSFSLNKPVKFEYKRRLH